ncbi:MAG: hypothetical protein WCF77_03105 [Minisyncoccia bacterium]|jgi:hypothetical protein
MKIVKILILLVAAFLIFVNGTIVNGIGLPSVNIPHGEISVWQNQVQGTDIACPMVVGSYYRGSPFAYLGFEYSGCSLRAYLNFLGALLDLCIFFIIGYFLFRSHLSRK